MKTNDLLSDFVADAQELLDSAEQGLLLLERLVTAGGKSLAGDLNETLNDLFRSFHTLKGTAGFFDLSQVVRLSHCSEEILEEWREDPEQIPGEQYLIERLLHVCDFLRSVFGGIQASGSDADCAAEVARLIEDLCQRRGPRESEAAAPPPAFGLFLDPAATISNAPVDEPPGDLPKLLWATASSDERIEEGDPQPVTEPVPEPRREAAPVNMEPDGIREDRSDLQESVGRVPANSDIRIATEKIDSVVDMIGELVILDSVIQRVDRDDTETLDRTTAQLGGIVRRLQETALSLRMIPLSRVFRRLPRVVADQQRELGKKIELITMGGEIEIDKSICDGLSEPLVHLVRNSLDHGLETPEVRVQGGKNETGLIRIEARHVGSEVWITVADDGRGLDREKILTEARAAGRITNSDHVSDSELMGIIFEAGFSTAGQVTNISGRGVGLDSVKHKLQELKGRIDVRSERGKGTEFQMRIPLTLSIVAGMIVRSGDQHFVIPTIDIEYSVGMQDCSIVQLPGERNMLKHGEKFYPVLEPAALLGRPSVDALNYPLVIILGRDEKHIGMLIDEVVGSQNIVIKALPDYLRGVRGFAGCTILGDGSVSLIVDTQYLVETYRGVVERTEEVAGV